MKRESIFQFSAMILLFCPAAFAQDNFGPILGDAEKGEKVYIEHACYGCHGYNGTGRRKIVGSPTGLRPESRALTYLANNASGILFNETVFTSFLRARADSNPEFPTQSMPHYPESSLSNADVRDLYAYIRSLVDEPPALEEIPLMREILEDYTE